MRNTRLFALVLPVLALLIAAPALAETAALVWSTGEVEMVDLNNPGKHAMPAEPTEVYSKAGGITFNVVYDDVTANNDRGFDDPVQGANRRARVAEIFDYLNTVLNYTGRTCDVKFLPSQTYGSGYLATGGTYFSGTAGFTNGYAFQHINSGIDPSGSVPDIEVTVDFAWPWYQGTDIPTPSQLDLKSVLLHELTHGLGLLSLAIASGSGTPQIGANTYAVWDDFLRTGNGKDLFGGSPPHFLGIPSDLVGFDGGIRFTGTNATERFGSAPPIYCPNPFQDGSSLAHWTEGGKIAGGAVMEPQFSYGQVIREYRPVDLGALEDIGWNMMPAYFECTNTYSSTDVPKPIDFLFTPTQSQLNIPDSAVIIDVNVKLNVLYPFDADLTAVLVSPASTGVELFSGVGGAGDNFVNTVLDDDATTPIASGTAPFTGSYIPSESLAAFTGQNMQGTWRLLITNGTEFETYGNLTGWSLTITYQCSGGEGEGEGESEPYISGGGWKEEGTPVTLTVVFPAAVGNTAYQWFKDSSELFGETDEAYAIDSVCLADEGFYACQVTDESKGSHLTNPVAITVVPSGSLPAAGLVGLCVVAVACVAAGAFIIMRKEK